MYFRIIRNDIKKSKLIAITTLLFIAAAATLVSLAAILLINLFGAVDTLMAQAKTPHLLQMHTGEIDLERLEHFAENNALVDEYQTLEFLGIDGAEFQFNGRSLSGSVMDNGFSVQSGAFDYLLDLEGNPIQAKDGEVYIPLFYWKDGIAQVGDTLSVHGKQFTVAGLLRDSQMNSALAQSKRCLISENDYAALKDFGSVEYLIEFRMKDPASLGAFESDYVAAGLEANGPMVSYANFQLMNSFTDGIMVAIILLIAILVVFIAFLCIRFTLLAKIEDDYREIGVMKAIGLQLTDIKKIYLAKYAALAAIACLLGFALSFAFRGGLTENIRLYMGESKNAALALPFGLVGVILVFAAVLLYVNGVLRRFRNISASQALRFGMPEEKTSGTKKFFRLSKSRLLNTNVFLGIKDVLARKSLYITMLAVVVLSSFIILVPRNLSDTISGDNFSSYMGVGNSDMRLDIQQTDHISEKAEAVSLAMAKDESISSYSLITSKRFGVMMEDGSEERILIELGDHSVFPINCFEGNLPETEGEIALSSLNADALAKGVGDTLTLITGEGLRSLTVSGIYSDFTNGGKAAKARFTDDSADTMWSILNAKLKNPAQTDQKLSEYAKAFPYAKVSSINAAKPESGCSPGKAPVKF